MTAPAPTPRRIQLSRAKGWRMPENTVRVDRTTAWGNPFKVGRDGDARRCVELFQFMLQGMLPVTSAPSIEDQRAYRDHLRAHVADIRGKNLACWCKPGAPCHADVLLDMANRPTCEAVS
ncbi:DUF4326 domain-containing protein [Xanthobacter flavus]|uniref:DUF4326 domain-containing protein n=1 Tax=Xanthobacter flavus TaxID=281 RepID=UPI003726DC2C